MLRLFVATLMVFCVADFANCDDHPDNMLGFIRSQTIVGLQRIDKSNDCAITILTNEEAEAERDIASLDTAKLFAKHTSIAERASKTLAAFRASLEKKERDLPRGTKYGEPKIRVMATAGSLHKVLHVGKDYILLQSANDVVDSNDTKTPKKLALSSQGIHEIRWYRGPLYGTSVQHLRSAD
ncbi:MAG: hypothetical protein Aurels2KO_41740 [Aureliella sp.]